VAGGCDEDAPDATARLKASTVREPEAEAFELRLAREFVPIIDLEPDGVVAGVQPWSTGKRC
jgi:hypothetical protein